ncbi:MAG: c-type cytochrome [Pirellulaceae bacterium]
MIHRSLVLVAMLPLSAVWSGDLGASGPVVPGYERAHRQGLSNSIQGSLLASELGCTACHRDKNSARKTAPSLIGVRQRLSVAWVEKFLEQPQASKPGTTMPHLLGHLQVETRADTIRQLVQYLASLQPPKAMFDLGLRAAVQPTVPRYWEKGDSQRGAKLYHSVGCIACHPVRNGDGAAQPSRLTKLRSQGYDEEEIAEIIRASGASAYVPEVPHSDLAAKYSKQALAVFLFDPDRFRSGSRMPNMKLAPDEAADLVAFLTSGAIERDDWPAVDKKLAEEGRRVFDKMGCIQCHAQDTPTNTTAPDWLTLRPNRGCLAEEPQPADYQLSDGQRDSLRRQISDSTAAKPSAELSLLRFNCLACHRRNGTGGVGIDRWHHFENVGDVDIGDEGRIPPTLDGVGRKLQNQWMTKVLRGEGGLRPFLKIRMPIFRHPDVQALPTQLEVADEGRREKAEDIFPRIEPTAALAISDTGCVQCHTMGSEQLPGIVGVEITGLSERLRPEWFREFMRNPVALKSRTRMPTFFPNGKSSRPDLLDGNVDEQIASLWWYLADSEGVVLPEKLVKGRLHNFELKPQDSPIVLRTFVHDVGTHAICVGFPQGVHLAFDGRQTGPRLFWKGRFLDAHGTWYDRFIPPAKPLGTDVVAVISGPGAHNAKLTDTWPDQVDNLRLRGYRLVSGVPTFRYRVGSTQIQDRMTPHNGGFVRRLEVAGADTPSVWIQLAAGKQIEHQGTKALVDQLTLSSNVLERAEVVGVNPRRIVISTAKMPSVISIEYRW